MSDRQQILPGFEDLIPNYEDAESLDGTENNLADLKAIAQGVQLMLEALRAQGYSDMMAHHKVRWIIDSYAREFSRNPKEP